MQVIVIEQKGGMSTDTSYKLVEKDRIEHRFVICYSIFYTNRKLSTN